MVLMQKEKKTFETHEALYSLQLIFVYLTKSTFQKLKPGHTYDCNQKRSETSVKGVKGIFAVMFCYLIEDKNTSNITSNTSVPLY